VTLRIVRGGQTQEVAVVLAGPSPDAAVKPVPPL
jgi:hypothetical protein